MAWLAATDDMPEFCEWFGRSSGAKRMNENDESAVSAAMANLAEPYEQEIARLKEENRLLSAIRERAELLLWVTMKEPVSERVAEHLGNLSLAARDHYNWRTSRIRAVCTGNS
jgi:hypothetical protein